MRKRAEVQTLEPFIMLQDTYSETVKLIDDERQAAKAKLKRDRADLLVNRLGYDEELIDYLQRIEYRTSTNQHYKYDPILKTFDMLTLQEASLK